MRALLACVGDFLRYGPHGGPAMHRHDTYRWVHHQLVGRAGLWLIWVGLGAAGAVVPLPPAGLGGRGMTFIEWSPAAPRTAAGAPWHPSLQRGQDHAHRTPQHA